MSGHIFNFWGRLPDNLLLPSGQMRERKILVPEALKLVDGASILALFDLSLHPEVVGARPVVPEVSDVSKLAGIDAVKIGFAMDIYVNIAKNDVVCRVVWSLHNVVVASVLHLEVCETYGFEHEGRAPEIVFDVCVTPTLVEIVLKVECRNWRMVAHLFCQELILAWNKELKGLSKDGIKRLEVAGKFDCCVLGDVKGRDVSHAF